MRVAAVDVGSDSTRLLIADVEDGQLTAHVRRSVPTQLSAGLYTSGKLMPAAMMRVFNALDEFSGEIQAHACRLSGAVLTSAIRDAQNGPSFAAEVRSRYRMDARVIGGEDEAALTFDGATFALSLDAPTLVVDIGGGSTEFVVGDTDGVTFRLSSDVGVTRNAMRFLHSDPPRPEEVTALAERLRGMLESSVPESTRNSVGRGLLAAESWTWRHALAAIDPTALSDRVLTRGLMEAMVPRLSSLRVDELRQIPGVHPARAPTLVAGTVLVLEVLRAFGLDRLELSDSDLLEGLALRLPSRVASVR